ncbi:hypothetical protein [uncultured Helicobacter sp.]|nr:hypothetical protein [uncultured Helicobacter sp.]
MALIKWFANYKLSHDNLVHSLLGFFNVESSLYQESLLFNPMLKENE